MADDLKAFGMRLVRSIRDVWPPRKGCVYYRVAEYLGEKIWISDDYLIMIGERTVDIRELWDMIWNARRFYDVGAIVILMDVRGQPKVAMCKDAVDWIAERPVSEEMVQQIQEIYCQ